MFCCAEASKLYALSGKNPCATLTEAIPHGKLFIGWILDRVHSVFIDCLFSSEVESTFLQQSVDQRFCAGIHNDNSHSRWRGITRWYRIRSPALSSIQQS